MRLQGNMTKILAGAFATIIFAVNTMFAQAPLHKPGPVWEMYYYRAKPGQATAAAKDFRENGKRFLDEAVKEGFFMDYKVFVNPLKNSPKDWDTLLMLEFPNYAALDRIDTNEAKIEAIYAKIAGSKEAAAEAARKRATLRDVIAIRLVREMPLK